MDAENRPPPTRAEARAPDILGSVGIYFLFLGLVQLLWVEHASMSSSLRGGILTLLTGGGFLVALELLAPGKDGASRAPRTANSLGLLTCLTLVLGLVEFGRAYHLPPSSLAGLGLGVVFLWAGQSLESGVLGLFGAAFLHANLNEVLGLRLGLSGSFFTSHIFLGMGLALGLIALGVWKERRGFRTEGLCMIGYGSIYLLSGLYLLSVLGEFYHGVPESAWIHRAYLGVLLLFGLGLIRLARGLRSGALAVIPTLALYLRALHLYLEWRGEIPETGLYMTLGILLLALAYRAEGDHPSLDGPRPQPLARQLRLLGQATLVALLLLGTAAGRGVANRSGSQEALRIPLDCHILPPLLVLDVEPFAIEFPPRTPGGSPLDVHLQIGELTAEDPLLRVTRAMATTPGAGVPGDLEEGRVLTVPGWMIDVRFLNGLDLRFVAPRHRSLFELPRERWGEPTEGHELSFRKGRLGFPFPGELVEVEARTP